MQGSCITNATQVACAQTGGFYLGDGSSCSIDACTNETSDPSTPITPDEACLGETITLQASVDTYFEYDWQMRDPDDFTWDTLPGGLSTVQLTVHEEGLWVFRYRQRSHGSGWSVWSELVGQTMVTDCAPTGGCCVAGECSETTAANCEGAYLGDWVSCAAESCNANEGETGACCVEDICTVVLFTDCIGTYLGEGTDCSNAPCSEVLGSCCIGESCVRITIDSCLDESGIYRGDHTLCSENPCEEVVVGACCLGSDCYESSENDCMGQWLGEGTECEEDSCQNEDTIIGPFQWKKENGGNDHWYAIVVTDELCWVDANAAAHANGAYMLTLTTSEEYAWWLATFGGTGEEPYIGLRQHEGSVEPDDGWEWANGEGNTFDNWASGSPDDVTGEANVAQLFTSGYWDDVVSCGATSYAIEFGQWFNVCETCEYTTIQAAVNDAADVETIYVDEGTYISVDGEFLVDLQSKDISIVGAGSDLTILDGQYAVSGLRFAYGALGNALLEGITIQHCVDREGAGVSVSGGSLRMLNCVGATNQATEAGQSGGAIQASGSANLSIEGCEFTENAAMQFGGAIYLVDSGTSAMITDCLFAQNESSVGGAIYVSNGTTCNGDLIEFSENIAGDGGAVSVTGNGSSFMSCCFQSNNALGIGGAMDNSQGAGTMLTDCLFVNNTAVYEGGAIYNNDSNPILYQCTLASNISYEENGGGLHNDNTSMPSVESTLFCGNIGRGSSESTLEGHIYPTVVDSDYVFVGGNEFHALCSTCQGDINGDGEVDLTDLIAIAMISVWGECDDCLADLDNNGVVDPDDIVILIELLTSRLDRPCDIECPYRF